jgi:hypothetical protein
MDFSIRLAHELSTLAAPAPTKSHMTLWTFLIGLVMFLFIGVPLAASGWYALGGAFAFFGLIAMFIAFVMNNDNQKKNRQARRVAQQMAKLYPQGFLPPQQIIIQTPAASTHSEVTREIVKVRCKSCNMLNYETANRCSNCGASL